MRTKGKCPRDAMFPIDPLWVYIAVPAVLVSMLILIKLGQREMDKIIANASINDENEEVGIHKEEAEEEGVIEAEETQEKPETPEKIKPQGCANYLGYLYMKKAPNETHIPIECYNCPDLLKCLYSPAVVEKVYGE